jgi:hypothetical protein
MVNQPMPLTIGQLKQGISYWRRDTKWPRDFHNEYYQDLAAINPRGGFNQRWWEQFLPILRAWRATRPCSSTFLTCRAQAQFGALHKAWTATVAPHLAKDIGELEWHQIAEFPILVAKIKDVASPVFSSKFCHFLAPHIFPVVDNAAMGNPFGTYEKYFTTARAEWCNTDAKTQAKLSVLLTREIGGSVFSGFPMKCKLIELCMIGRRQNSRGADNERVV